MFMFKFNNASTDSTMYVNLLCYDVAFHANGISAELYPVNYQSQERYSVTGNDLKRLKAIMDEYAVKTIAEREAYIGGLGS